MLRTQALLGVASDLLGQMSDGRFGFADSFDIVSRNSGVAHPPNRLSGGEKFQASLALALALAEPAPRAAARPSAPCSSTKASPPSTPTALDSALEVLRSQTNGNRLVVVISHLHAVAEAVDDVLLVERTPAGSIHPLAHIGPARRTGTGRSSQRPTSTGAIAGAGTSSTNTSSHTVTLAR
ncbi:hypothetical protein ACE6JH_00010 [Streptomyces nigra]